MADASQPVQRVVGRLDRAAALPTREIRHEEVLLERLVRVVDCPRVVAVRVVVEYRKRRLFVDTSVGGFFTH